MNTILVVLCSWVPAFRFAPAGMTTPLPVVFVNLKSEDPRDALHIVPAFLNYEALNTTSLAACLALEAALAK
jgi:hypothetical protein